MTQLKKIKDKKVNFEFNKEFIKVLTDKIDNKDGIWRECDKNKLVPLEAESYIDPTTQKSYIKFSPIPNI